MIDRLPILILLAAASLPAAAAAPDTQRSFTVTTFDRIRVDGPYKVTLRTDVAPYARANGSAYAIDGLSLKVEGRTLVIRTGNSGWGGYGGESRGPVTIEVGTHELSAAYINGAGALDIDRVRGLGFELSISGSGLARIDQVDVDQMRVGIVGAGTSRLSGRVAKLNASVRGTSALEADGLQVTDAVIGAEGPSIVRAQVTNSARVEAYGLVSVTLTGDPACTVKARGSANVVGCRESRF
jgi:Putative auto-transporter adhesin, head GIN domain